jgi:hypothetical protein
MLRRRHTIVLAALALTMSACGQASEENVTDAEAPAAAVERPGALAADPNAQFCAEIGRRVSAADCADLSALADQARQGVAAFNAPNPMQRGDVHTLQLAISFAPTPEQQAASQAQELERDRASESAQAARRLREREEALYRRAYEEKTDDAYEAYLREFPNGRYAQSIGDHYYIATGGPTPEPPPLPAPPTPSPSTPDEVVDPLQGDTVQYTPLVGRFMRAELTGNGFEITPLSQASQEVLPESVTTWSWRVEANEGGQRALTLRTVVEGCTADGQCFPLRSTSQNYDVTVQVGPLGQVQDFLAAAPTWLRLLAGVLTALAVLVGAWFGLRNAFRKGRAGA